MLSINTNNLPNLPVWHLHGLLEDDGVTHKDVQHATNVLFPHTQTKRTIWAGEVTHNAHVHGMVPMIRHPVTPQMITRLPKRLTSMALTRVKSLSPVPRMNVSMSSLKSTVSKMSITMC